MAAHNNGIRITVKLKQGAQNELLPIDCTDYSKLSANRNCSKSTTGIRHRREELSVRSTATNTPSGLSDWNEEYWFYYCGLVCGHNRIPNTSARSNRHVHFIKNKASPRGYPWAGETTMAYAPLITTVAYYFHHLFRINQLILIISRGHLVHT